jgi:hypothetical protein
MRINSIDSDVKFTRLKETLEEVYPCLGITCAQVGGLYDGEAYFDGADPCFDGAPIVDRSPEDSTKADDTGNETSSGNPSSGNPSSGNPIIVIEEDNGVNVGIVLGIGLAVLMAIAICGLGFVHVARSNRKHLDDQTNIAAVTAVSEVDLA